MAPGYNEQLGASEVLGSGGALSVRAGTRLVPQGLDKSLERLRVRIKMEDLGKSLAW